MAVSMITEIRSDLQNIDHSTQISGHEQPHNWVPTDRSVVDTHALLTKWIPPLLFALSFHFNREPSISK